MIQAQIDAMRWIKNQKLEAIHFLRQFFATDEATAIESYNVYVPLIVDDVRVSAEGVESHSGCRRRVKHILGPGGGRFAAGGSVENEVERRA